MYYVYRHIRLDKNEVFYIGISKRKYPSDTERAKTSFGRSKHWRAVVNKTKFKSEVIFVCDTLKEVYEKEKEFIKLYGRKDLKEGTLVNKTDGGDGACGRVITETERQNRILGSKKRTSYPPMSQETKEKISKSLKKYKSIHGVSKDTALKISIAKKNHIVSEDTREKIRIKLSKPKIKKEKAIKNDGTLSKFSKNGLESLSISHSKILIDQYGNEYKNIKDASIRLGISIISVNRLLSGKAKSVKGIKLKRK